MLKINKKYSVAISIGITYLCFVMLTAVALTAHDYNRLWFGAPEVPSELSIVVFTYVELAIAYLAVALLLMLLRQIRRHAVFVSKNVSILRGLSYCCFAEATLFVLEALMIRLGGSYIALLDLLVAVLFLVSFACGFIGIILRVVKNALEEGVSLKDENDYTI